MLDVGWSELLVIAIVMIVVVGPKDLPKMLRAFGKATARMRSTANEFRQQFNEALKEAELEDVKNIIDETRKLDPRSKLTQVFDPIRSAGEDLKSSMEASTSMSPATPEKIAEVTTPVDLNGAPVVPSEPVKTAEKEQAPAKAKPATRAKRKASAEKPAIKPASSAKTGAAKAKTSVKPASARTSAAKAAPAKAAASEKKPAAKAVPSAKKPANKKTSPKTGPKTGIKA
ncbi:Sec-independent protein translocase protein TatB [Brucella sp. BE17]|uniref:Sec-independent protein translocase protein TatB n=1 Tax=Brucella sp. BE17 TaxID=3142977 RepID=UPI0031BA0EE4